MLDELTGGDAAGFLATQYGRLPRSGTGLPARVRDLGRREILDRILADPKADARVAREGRWVEGRPRNGQEARAVQEEGGTIFVRHAERHDAGLAALAAEVRSELGGEVDIHIYATPAGRSGFGWHYDAEEVFLLQTGGRRRLRLRKNTVHPLPIRETLPRDMAYEREASPLMLEVRLEEGDWAYVPAGWWHRADALEGGSLALAVGIAAPAALGVLDFIRRDLAQSPVWRQRLPVEGSADPSPPEAREERIAVLFRGLGEDLARRFQDPTLPARWLRRDSAP